MNVDKLDRAFSDYIRQRDCLPGTEINVCISCGKTQYWKESDCGHYVNRKHMSTRFNEKNCNAQCKYCNRFCEGNMSGYTLGLIKKYGADIIEFLVYLKNKTVKYSQFEIDELTKYYKLKTKELIIKQKLNG
jgi:hypothetical protein